MTIRKTTVFRILILFIPVFFFLLLEFFLQRFQYGGTLDLLVTPPEEAVSHYYMGNPNVSRRYFFAQKNLPNPAKDLILKQKPKNGYRIFVMGGSTAAGFPYANNLMFSRILHRYLEEYFPDRTVEVMNTAMTAINSYAFIDLIDEVLEQKPDLIIIYAGHNEFYGAMGIASIQSVSQSRWLIKTYLALKDFRTFLLLRDLIGRLRLWLSKSQNGNEEAKLTATLMERIVSNQVITKQSDVFRKGMLQFKNNMSQLLDKTTKAGVPVVLSEVVSNLRDQKPFGSSEGEALAVYNEAKTREKEKNYQQALALFYKAKDLDVVRFRAPEEINVIINNLGKQYDVPVVPMKEVFEAASPNRLIGDHLMTDHLHPNMDGYFLMATALLETIKSTGIITRKQPVGEILTIKDWGITALDSACADLNIRYLKGGWPFQPEGTVNATFSSYRPESKAESLAVRVLVDHDYSIESAHVDLAAYYYRKAMYQYAYREYQALVYTVPHEISFYEEAAKMLIKMDRKEEALSLLERSIVLRETEFNTKWIGQILLFTDRIEAAIPYLERARGFVPDDLQLLYNLCRAYIVTGNGKEASTLFKHIQETYPHSPYVAQLKILGAEMQRKHQAANRYIMRADSLLKQQKLQAALPLYQKALAQVSSSYSMMRIGQIYLMQQMPQKAIPVFEKAYLMNPLDYKISYNLAGAYYLVGRYNKSETILRELERHNPDFADPSHLRERLSR
jgi:tetratricopeptide (TPR) repeat protein